MRLPPHALVPGRRSRGGAALRAVLALLVARFGARRLQEHEPIGEAQRTHAPLVQRDGVQRRAVLQRLLLREARLEPRVAAYTNGVLEISEMPLRSALKRFFAS